MFALPIFAYLIGVYALIGLGLWLYAANALPTYVPPAGSAQAHGSQALGILLILRAFASGSVALTGTEAVSNGVPAFRPPETTSARRVLITMGALFARIFLGISFVAAQLGIVPDPSEQETVISQITRTLVGAGSPFHYAIQLTTAMLLVLAANTAYAGFPRLASILGKDGFMPRQFQFRGDRLSFSVGIMVLSVLAALLIIAFEGSVTDLIPLYTSGCLSRSP